MKKVEREFAQIGSFIVQSRDAAIGFMNYAAVATYWTVGVFVSARLKSAAWGSKTVVELGDYLKTRYPKLKGFGRRQIYNMVVFYDTYSTAEFRGLSQQLKLDELVQAPTAQIVHLENAQFAGKLSDVPECPMFLALTNFTNHVIIMNGCRRLDEKVFYILHGARERLKTTEMRRAIDSDAYSSVMSKNKLVSKALGTGYPGAEFLLKDRALLDFLNLPAKHTEPQPHEEIRENIKKFILELGKNSVTTVPLSRKEQNELIAFAVRSC